MKLIMTIRNYSLKSSSMFCFYDDLSTAGLSGIVNDERCWIYRISQPIPHSDPMVKLAPIRPTYWTKRNKQTIGLNILTNQISPLFCTNYSLIIICCYPMKNYGGMILWTIPLGQKVGYMSPPHHPGFTPVHMEV